MNKLLKSLIILIVTTMLLGINNVVSANNTVGALALNTQKDHEQGSTFEVAVNFSNMQTDETESFGISGNIEYDKEKLEFVSITSNTAAGWDAVSSKTFKESSMYFWFQNEEIADKGPIGANSNIFTLKFKAKDNVEGTANIKIKVEEVSHATNFPDATTTVNITKKVEQEKDDSKDNDSDKKEEQKEEEKQNDSGSGSSSSDNKNESGTDKTIKKDVLPKAGENNAVSIGISISAIVAVVALALYIRIKYIEKSKM